MKYLSKLAVLILLCLLFVPVEPEMRLSLYGFYWILVIVVFNVFYQNHKDLVKGLPLGYAKGVATTANSFQSNFTMAAIFFVGIALLSLL